MFVEEELGLFPEFVWILSREVVYFTIAGAACLDVRMMLGVLLETVSYVFALGYDADAARDIFVNLGQQQRIVRTSQDNGIYLPIKTHKLVYALLDKIVGSG